TVDGPDRLEALETIQKGTVIFTAHGISPAVYARAAEKNLHVVDATCPDVTRTHDLIRQVVADDYEVIYVGKHGHPEPEGAVGVAPEHVHLIEKVEDIDELPPQLAHKKIIVTNQTTMSQWDVQALMEHVRKKYPHVEVHNEICNATQVRQEAVADQAGDCDLVIVVGDPRSNNSNRLAQVSFDIAGTPAHRIGDLTELDLSWLEGVQQVGVTSGASTPTPITKKVIDFLQQYDPTDISTHDKTPFLELRRILPKVKVL
ncbi:MAG TPA: 4-hydroxy-3-methylbut-2-enyl diphosphate reductase, partial [Exiguobacterium sp.]|nr:4-hydroxy-3-methylbut-2-enyl diphosphate reductase [Exiguobacterium sp.]